MCKKVCVLKLLRHQSITKKGNASKRLMYSKIRILCPILRKMCLTFVKIVMCVQRWSCHITLSRNFTKNLFFNVTSEGEIVF